MRVILPESIPFAEASSPNELVRNLKTKREESTIRTIVTEPEEWIDTTLDDASSAGDDQILCAPGSFIFASEYGLVTSAGGPRRSPSDDSLGDPWKCTVPGTEGNFWYS